MPVKLKIKVTREILERTKNCRSNDLVTNCAIAEAARDIFPDASLCDEYIHTIFYNDRRDSHASKYSIRLPKKARDFITAFDFSPAEYRATMSPIEFEISIPDAVIDRINIDELRPLLTNHPTLELVN